MNENQNLPEKYNPNEREQIWREFWEREKIYKFDETENGMKKPIFSVDTPPPYVSADHLHAGHIMSYSQAEFVVRFKRMNGFNVFYPMGFDDNGLPTERFVEKKYKIEKDKITRSEFIQKCLEETKIGAETYKNLWTLLGISVDWSKTYSTINNHSQKISQWSFIDLYKKGLLKREMKPMHWCITCQTALAQADLEDKEEESFLNTIEFSGEDGTPLLIATTRPELIPACVALFYNPKDKRYEHLKGKKAIVPILNYEVPILEDEAVDIKYGSGLMMVCTWGDIEDIEKWQKHKLDARNIFNEKGILNELAGKYAGSHLSKLRGVILEELKTDGKLKNQEKLTHTLNVHERCDTPVEFVLTKQWFINVMDHKHDLLEKGTAIKWHPEKMEKIYENWINGLKWDWCISRQRYYGVPFPVWYCEDCGHVILPEQKDLPVDPTENNAPTDTCPECQSKNIVGEKDVMDTWMTSSLTPIIGAKLVENEKIQKKLYPSSLRPQAFEIIRTWLFYTVAKSLFHHDSIPFTDAMISGHGLDGQGRKISKRLGNYVVPDKIIAEYGADALRYWATGATLGENLRYSEDEIKKGKKTVNKLFNASKFVAMFMGNDSLAVQPLSELSDTVIRSLEPADKWVLDRLSDTIIHVTKYFENYEYSKARNTIDDFFWKTFTDNYLEFVKYRLYDDSEENKESKQVAQQTLYTCLLSIIKLYAPIMPYVTEEIYQSLFKGSEGVKSIHISEWPAPINVKSEKDFEEAIKTIGEIRKHKSDNAISLGKDIGEFDVKGSENLKKYEEFIKKVGKVINLKIV